MEPDLSVELRKLRLSAPVMPAAGTFGFGEEYAELYEPASFLGALVTKTLTLRPRQGNPQPRLWETPCGLLNSIGLENPGLSAFVEEIFPRLLRFHLPIVVSVYGENAEEYGELGRYIPREAAGLELNLSCPNLPGKPAVLSAEEIFSRVAAAREAWPGELWAKISPEGDWLSAAQAAEEAGADAVVATNTFRGMALDLERRSPVFANVVAGLSGPAIKPLCLHIVYELCRVLRIPVIGCGGIKSGRDALEFILAGAHAVQVGTANFFDPLAIPRILQEMRDWLKKEGLKGLEEVRGCAQKR